MAIQVLFLYCSKSLHPETCLFANHSNSSAWIMVGPKLTFVLLRAPFLSPLSRKWWFTVCLLWLWCETWVSRTYLDIKGLNPMGLTWEDFNVSSPMGHSWEEIMSLFPQVTHGKILRSLHLCKTPVESKESTWEPFSWEDFTLLVNHMIVIVSSLTQIDHVRTKECEISIMSSLWRSKSTWL